MDYDNGEMQERYDELNAKYLKLYYAALAIYHAGHWICDRECNEAKLWEELRDAMGLPSGTAPKQIK